METGADNTEKTSVSGRKIDRPIRLIWGITGAGDRLAETLDVMESIGNSGNVHITAFLSRAAEKVIKYYGLRRRLETLVDVLLREIDANTPFICGDLQTGKFDILLVAPATANTVAKIVHGIADTLATNAVAMANKTYMKVHILPVDNKMGKLQTILPDGRELTLNIRDVDAENTEKLRKMPGIFVMESPEQIRGELHGNSN